MMTRQQNSAHRAVLIVPFVAVVFCSAPAHAIAQDREQPSPFLAGLAKQVMLDPTTYAPAVIGYDATIRDWKTSQPFFRNGFIEHNSGFTISGLPDGVPVSYDEGNRRILIDAFSNLGMSVVNNFTDRVFERILMQRHPDHPRIVKTIGWIERVSFGAYTSYLLSADHYRQAQANTRGALERGYR